MSPNRLPLSVEEAAAVAAYKACPFPPRKIMIGQMPDERRLYVLIDLANCYEERWTHSMSTVIAAVRAAVPSTHELIVKKYIKDDEHVD